jgi:transcriptional regulator with XRE-family HTH domain
MNDERARQLGEYIRHLRLDHAASIRGLADRAGIDSGGLTRLESGHVLHPRPDTLSALAQALEVPLADLFARAGYTAPHDLPSVEPYLRTKYDCLSRKETEAITTLVEALTHLHQPDRQ